MKKRFLFGGGGLEVMSESSKAKFLEKNATPQQLEMGADLADWVVEEMMAEGEGIQGVLCDE